MFGVIFFWLVIIFGVIFNFEISLFLRLSSLFGCLSLVVVSIIGASSFLWLCQLSSAGAN